MALFRQSLLDAVQSINWWMATGLFILPPTLVGTDEGIPLIGFAVGFAFCLYVVLLQIIMPI